jgi:hypothetical protein
MIRVYRPAVVADLDAVAAGFDEAFLSIVAACAQRLQLAEHKLVPVAAVGLDVIDHGCPGNRAAFRAEFTKRMLA